MNLQLFSAAPSPIDVDKDTQLQIPVNTTFTDSNISSILQLLFAILGGIAVIVIIIAGIHYMLSQGDPQKANNARNTIIYAAVGLGLAAGAFALVKLVAGSLL